MHADKTYRVGFLLLLLLVSHEGIAVANNIRQTKSLFNDGSLHGSLRQMMDWMENADVNSFVEVQNMHGMSSQEYATYEVKEMHRSLHEGFGFERSPILEDLNKLTTIPENTVLSPKELTRHRAEVSVLLEKALSGVMMRAGGECERTTTFTCSVSKECRPAKRNPCQGKCVCDTVGANECECRGEVNSDTVLDQLDKSQMKGDKHTGWVCSNGPKPLTGMKMMKHATFGFFDGMFSGILGILREEFDDQTCETGDVAVEMDGVLDRLKHLWGIVKTLHKSVWTETGRKSIVTAVRGLFHSLMAVVKQMMEYLKTCQGAQTLLKLSGFVLAAMVFNVIFMLAGWVIIPMIIKIVGGIVGLYYSMDFLKDKINSLVKSVKQMKQKKCDSDCKGQVVEDVFGVVGVFTDVILLGGLKDLLTDMGKVKGLLQQPKIGKIATGLLKKWVPGLWKPAPGKHLGNGVSLNSNMAKTGPDFTGRVMLLANGILDFLRMTKDPKLLKTAIKKAGKKIVKYSKIVRFKLLNHTKYTIDNRGTEQPCKNSVRPGNDVNNGDPDKAVSSCCPSETAANSFLEAMNKVKGTIDVSQVGGSDCVVDASEVFEGVTGDSNEFSFDCTTSMNLCNCIVHLGETKSKASFTHPDVGKLTMDGTGGGVTYLFSGDERRRRLLAKVSRAQGRS